MITIKALNSVCPFSTIFRHWISHQYSLKFETNDIDLKSFIFNKHNFSNFKISYIKNQEITKSSITFVYQNEP